MIKALNSSESQIQNTERTFRDMEPCQPSPVSTYPLQEPDRHILSRVTSGLKDATDLYRWWIEAERRGIQNRTPVALEFQNTDTNYMFREEVPLDNGPLPVVGLVQDMFYDRSVALPGEAIRGVDWCRRQIQEFVLKYFMRVSASRQFQDSILHRSANPDSNPRDLYEGWGYYQLYFKRKGSGEIGKFPVEKRFQTVDLREIGQRYEWIVFKVRFFDFLFRRPLARPDGPSLQLQMALDNYVVIDSNFIINRDHPEPGVLGEYGFGTPVVPVSNPNSFLAYGPSGLAQAFQFIIFRVLKSGEIRVKLIFIGNLPKRIFKFNPLIQGINLLDFATFRAFSSLFDQLREQECSSNFETSPLFALTDFANFLSGGLAERLFCISRNQIYEEVMATHFFALNRFILQTLPIWANVGNWLDDRTLPRWAIDGTQPREG